jgi:hypothetical protein
MNPYYQEVIRVGIKFNLTSNLIKKIYEYNINNYPIHIDVLIKNSYNISLKLQYCSLNNDYHATNRKYCKECKICYEKDNNHIICKYCKECYDGDKEEIHTYCKHCKECYEYKDVKDKHVYCLSCDECFAKWYEHRYCERCNSCHDNDEHQEYCNSCESCTPRSNFHCDTCNEQVYNLCDDCSICDGCQ